MYDMRHYAYFQGLKLNLNNLNYAAPSIEALVVMRASVILNKRCY